ncbi:signal peptidase I [Actinomadura parmotrematis]|uniref:Signal peptidase I n=1 Tax=Actinomadura parmotrematis TaxID=2864039 RepID=A0ABS7FSW0_9ACTN|nr:signal peptidase I [Actinomadura parmotrematis]MBW8483045.1 signal peptidase I [Actinomadura parmotrematis]
MTSEDREVATAGEPDGPAGDDGARDGAADGAAAEPEEAAEPKRKRPFWQELPVLIFIALALALLIKAFAVQAFYIPSESMQNTLMVGDRVLVNKIVYHTRDIERGDVIVFRGPESWGVEVPQHYGNPVSKALHTVGGWFGVANGEKDYIKRVIGVPGDHVTCAGDGAPIVVNGTPLKETSYLYPGNTPSDTKFDITVPPGRLWVMGDHRADSADSRSHQDGPDGGTIPEKNVIGRAFVVVWPFGDAKTLPIPKTS